MTDKKPASDTPASDSPIPNVRRISQPRLKKIPAKVDPAPPVVIAAPESGPDARPSVPHGMDIPPAAPASAQDARAASSPGTTSRPAATEFTPEANSAASEAPETASSEWPEPDATTSGGSAVPDNKRKRRRRKGKGQGPQAHANPVASDDSPPRDDAAESLATATVTPAAPRPSLAPQSQPQAPPRQPAARTKVDPETLARKAWKIYLAEVSEEGVALIGDQDARELARRCFRLAEIFIEEQARRVPTA